MTYPSLDPTTDPQLGHMTKPARPGINAHWSCDRVPINLALERHQMSGISSVTPQVRLTCSKRRVYVSDHTSIVLILKFLPRRTFCAACPVRQWSPTRLTVAAIIPQNSPHVHLNTTLNETTGKLSHLFTWTRQCNSMSIDVNGMYGLPIHPRPVFIFFVSR